MVCILGRFLFKVWPTSLFKNIPYPEVTQNAKILDVGCGDGSFLNNLFQLGFVNLTGIDPFLTNEYSVDDKLRIRKADIYQIDETFDCIILKGTLEHQPNQLKLLNKIVETYRLGVDKSGRGPLRETLNPYIVTSYVDSLFFLKTF